MNRAQLSLFFEAVFNLAVARFYVRFFTFKNYVYRVGEPLVCEPEANDAITADNLQILRSISREINRAARNVPWNAVCLPQAMAGKWMLKRRNLPAIMFLGVAKENAAAAAEVKKIKKGEWQPGLKAHAWLKSGNYVVTGRQGHQQFTVVGRFE